MSNRSLRPLDGVRVLDLTVALSGPYAALLLAGLGAEVIHVEPPGEGEIARNNPPYVGRDGAHFDARGEGDVSLTILNRARNKKSITLDLKNQKGRELFQRLAKRCDVVLENLSEGATTKLEIDYESIRRDHPQVIYASIKAFGEGSYPGLKGMDVIVQALSGVMEATGFEDGPPTRVGLPIADMISATYAVNGILAALIYRGRTGEGQHVHVSMLDCLASWVAEEHFDVFARAGNPVRSGNFMNRLVPFGVYRTSDGYVSIVAFQPDWLKGLLDAIGRPELIDDPRFRTRGPRMQSAAILNDIIEQWSSSLTAEEVVKELLGKRGVPAAKVRKPTEVLADPKLHKSGAVTNLQHPRFGDIGAVGMGLPIQFSKSLARFDEPAQELGAANAQVYRDLLNLSERELDELRAARII